MTTPSKQQISLVVPSPLVKTIKSLLEENGYLEKSVKITKVVDTEGQYNVPTTWRIQMTSDKAQLALEKKELLMSLGGLQYMADVEIELIPNINSSKGSRSNSVLAQAIWAWVQSLPTSAQSSIPGGPERFIEIFGPTYSVYPPLLVLPSHVFSKDAWPEIIHGPLEAYLPSLYSNICLALNVTHIAINRPIALDIIPSSSTSNSKNEARNIMRLPLSLVPLHGDFGSPNLPPTAENFNTVFWATALQNGIWQTWAPLYTMFSRGNIKEKARLLNLRSLADDTFGRDPKETGAVDLYAGIGYFAFSFAKAGFGRVLCWELNGWSVEGLKRGAKKNKWSVKVVEGNAKRINNLNTGQAQDRDECLIVFHESNEQAAKRVADLRGQIPPIKHVNCGYLPSSKHSWKTAIKIIDSVEGGWIHAHENIKLNDISRRKEEIVEEFRYLVFETSREISNTPNFKVRCDHLERIKTYAPGVIHCVIDIALVPQLP
ncbi:MAG: hypothetical protein LQ342_000933 [Letrouitia transgressa]|nr:MAG: hypothetical protein LQ342_000933 [Letrouitia transgressa]